MVRKGLRFESGARRSRHRHAKADLVILLTGYSGLGAYRATVAHKGVESHQNPAQSGERNHVAELPE